MSQSTNINPSQPNSPQPENAAEAFANLGLNEALRRTVAAAGYSTPTPIQTAAIPQILGGRDLLGSAQTGTGKTAAFALPILQRLYPETSRAGAKGAGSRGAEQNSTPPRALVLAPTRELAAQIGDNFNKYAKGTKLRTLVVFGGVSKPTQVRLLRRGCDILVATPGRLMDLMRDEAVDLSRIETFVLDEADRMLDMGFVNDVKRIVRQIPAKRQTLFFSATMPAAVDALASSILRDPARVVVDPISSTREPISQSIFFVEKPCKTQLLLQLLHTDPMDRVLVFTRTKHGANRLVKNLATAGFGAAAIHGNKSQAARVRALEDFKTGRIRIVVATDIAARGIDIRGLSHVINFELPNEPESYVHRIGRTGRAGQSGIAISFCSSEERPYARAIERLTKRRLVECPMPNMSSKALAAAS